MRDDRGRFVPGAPGGPGRPRRAVEREYLAVLSEVCPLDTWRAVCERAVTDAEAGDARARAWLAQYVLGTSPMTLAHLAELEALDVSPEVQIGAGAYFAFEHAVLYGPEVTENTLAVHLAVIEPALAAADARDAAERERAARERAERRAARKAARLAAVGESSGPAVEPVPGDVGGVS